MKKITLLLFAIFSLTFSWQSMAQTQVGTGTGNTTYLPIYSCYGYTYSQQVYYASEINTSGDITSLSFYLDPNTSTTNFSSSTNWTVYLGHSTRTEFASTTDWEDATNLTQVFSGIVTFPAEDNWFTITLDAAFTYNGTDNLVLAIDENQSGFNCSMAWQKTDSSVNRGIVYRSDSTNPDPETPPTASSVYAYFSNVIFGGITQACPSPSNLTVTNIMATSADLSWTAGGTETLWNVEIVDVTAGGTVTGTATDSGVANPFLVSGLTPDNSYEYYVQADCGGDTSAWVGPFSFSTPPTCPEPSDLTATNIMTTSADLGWTENGSASLYNVEVVETGNTPTGTATDTGVANGFTKSGLLTSVTYDYYVQADCTGGDVSTWVGPYTFTTLCEPFTASYTQNFDAESTPDINACWSTILENPTSTYANIITSTAQSVSTSNSVRFYNSSDSTSDFYLVSPTFSDLDNTKRVVFQLYQNQGTSDDGDVVEVGTMTDPSDASTYTTFQTITYEERTEDSWTNIVVNFDTYAGTDNYVAIKINFGGTYNYYYIDDFVYEEIPSCLAPSDLAATNIMTTSADLGWTENGSASLYNVEVVETGNTPTGTATDTGVANGFTKSGLLPSVTYDYYVQADCTGGDVSTWVGPYTFTTLCEPFTASYTQNFDAESTPDINACWSTILENPTSTYANIITSTAQSVSTSNSVRFYNSSDSTSDFYLVSPTFSDLDNTKRVVFQLYQNQGTSDDGDVVEVGTMTDPSDASTYTTFQTITYEERTEDSWTNIVVNFDTYAGTDNYVAIKINFGGTYNYYYIDNFVYEEIPSCLEPSDLTATNIMATSADLGWTENGTASTYNVEVVLAGDAATGTATDTAVANGFTKSGLADNTDYEYYVQAICGGDTSAWSGPYAFTTLCAAIVPNYIADFSTIAPSCWTEGNDTDVATGPDGNNGGWINDDFLNTAGIEAAKFNLYSDFQQDWLVSPVFDFSSGGYGLAFDVGVTAWNSTDAETPNLMGSDDEVLLLISEDNGVTWTTLEAFNVENAPSHTGDNKIYDLSTITSSTVKFAFWATDGSVDDAEDIDFFVANFNVDSYATLGVSEVEDKVTFTYYPNPVNNNLTLSAQKEINNVSVYNMVGQEVFRNVPNAMTEVVDMSSLQAGAYFVKVTIGNATKTVKVIKN